MDNAHNDRRFAPVAPSAHLTKVEHKSPIHEIAAGKECPRCLLTADIAKMDLYSDTEQCEYCDLHDQLERNSHPEDLEPAILKIQQQGKYKKFDCLIGISGGLDSSTLLYLAVKRWGLRPLVIHFDNGYNDKAAESNMKNLIDKLNVNAIIYKVDKEEYDHLNLAFLEAGVPDADIPNDIAMTKLMYDTADKHGIKWILNGHDFRTEGSTPRDWTYMDARYIEDVYEKFMGKPLFSYPLFTFWDQIKYGLKGIKQIRPFHYNAVDRKQAEAEMKKLIGWGDYGPKHCENVYTEYVGAHLLPNKFNIDKRRVYLSAQIRDKQMGKSEAKLILQIPTRFDFSKFTDEDMRARIQVAEKSEKQPRTNFKRYNFRKWSIVVYVLALLKVVPFTFWYKYCKK